MNNHADQITDAQIRSVFKSSWHRSCWLREAKNTDSQLPICLLVPSLDLSKAERVWVRNKLTRERLANMGFTNVQVKRLRLLPIQVSYHLKDVVVFLQVMVKRLQRLKISLANLSFL